MSDLHEHEHDHTNEHDMHTSMTTTMPISTLTESPTAMDMCTRIRKPSSTAFPGPLAIWKR